MYLIRENMINGTNEGYFVDEKIQGKLIASYFVTLHPIACSCQHFMESKNKFNHFHINLVRNWIEHGKPECAIYAKSKSGKIVTLCPGFIKSSNKSSL